MVPEWRKHSDEYIASRGQGKSAEPVQNTSYIGDGRKQPVGIVLIGTLRVEGGNSEERALGHQDQVPWKAERRARTSSR